MFFHSARDFVKVLRLRSAVGAHFGIWRDRSLSCLSSSLFRGLISRELLLVSASHLRVTKLIFQRVRKESLRLCDFHSLLPLNWHSSRNLLSNQFLGEFHEDIISFNSLDFNISILLNEFTSSNVSTTDSDKDLVSFLDLNMHSSLSESVNTFWLSQEEDLQILFLWVLV